MCFVGWLIAAAAQFLFVLGLPEHASFDGIDLTAARDAALRNQWLIILAGVGLSATALRVARGATIAIAASALYLINWVPLTSLVNYGFAATASAMLLVGQSPGLRFTALVRDVLLPLVFVVAVVLLIRDLLSDRPVRK